LILQHDMPAVPLYLTPPWISSAHAGAGLRRKSSIRPMIFWNLLLGTATSANWNVTYRPWLTMRQRGKRDYFVGRANLSSGESIICRRGNA